MQPSFRRRAGRAEGQHFGMGRGILELLALVVARGNHTASRDNHGSHRHLILAGGNLGFFDRQPHPAVMLAVGKEFARGGTDVEHGRRSLEEEAGRPILRPAMGYSSMLERGLGPTPPCRIRGAAA